MKNFIPSPATHMRFALFCVLAIWLCSAHANARGTEYAMTGLWAELAIEEQGPTIDSLSGRVRALETDLKETQKMILRMEKQIQRLGGNVLQHQKQVAKVDSTLVDVQSSNSAVRSETQGLRSELNQTSQALDGRISTLDERGGQHWFITLLMVALVIALLFMVYWGLRHLLSKRVGVVGAELERINIDVQAKLMKVDAELITSLEKLLQAKTASAPAKTAVEVDHSLALKVADEVTRIEQNLAQMDASVKGHKQLTAAVKRLHENLQAAGYHLPPLLGKAFDEGMKVVPSFVPDDSLKDGERVITRVFKPTVLFKGQMVQVGEVQISTGN